MKRKLINFTLPSLAILAAVASLPTACKQMPMSSSESSGEPRGQGLTASQDQVQPVPRATASARKLSGYAVNDETCGEGSLKFPKVKVGMRAGFCTGIVASSQDGLKFPRSIVQIPNSKLYVVADMGGWGENLGRVLLLDPQASEGKRIRVLLKTLDAPHGLQVGPDGKVYVGEIDRVFRFDPLHAQPETTVETILQNLPGREPVTSAGTKLEKNAHPLKYFVFDSSGRLFLNVGAPTDNCISSPSKSETTSCAPGEGPQAMASVWVFTPPSNGIFPELKKGDKNPPHVIYASGLRNSMALAMHPRFPEPGFAFLQGENARDLPDAMKPNEELNALEEGRHYGWPYCYDLDSPSPEYANFLKSKSKFQSMCSGNALYKAPFSLLPPHSAPLGMFYYNADRFPELKNHLVVSLHGYRPTGSRLISFAVDEKGFPKVEEPPVLYGVSCAPEKRRPYQTESASQVAAAPFEELIGDWHKVNGVRPQGAPTNISFDSEGAIWIVEDKNQTILRVDRDPSSKKKAEALACDARGEEQIHELLTFIGKDKKNRERLTRIRTQFVEKHCMGCHSDFDLKPELSPGQRDLTVARFMLSQDGWIYPGDPESGRLHRRTWGKGSEKVMPANGLELIKNDPSYRALLEDLDAFVSTMVPGERKRIKLQTSPSLKLRNRKDANCGSIAAETVVVVVDGKPKDKPGFARIYRPADRFLNGECKDSDGYYVSVKYLAAP